MRSIATRLAAVALASLAVSGCMQGTAAEPEKTAYTVSSADKEFEVRDYGAQTVAMYSARGNYGRAVEEGYIKLERYFLGNNTVPEAMAMTVPVMVREDASGGWTTMRLLPDGYRVENAPPPVDQRIRVMEVPGRRVAAIRFPGKLSETVMREQAAKLDLWLATRGIAHKGDFTLAGYDQPWMPAAWRENEVIVTLN
jgi:DNA gyrase inhibitor GyrI